MSESIETPVERRPTLADALALIAATGIGLACWKTAFGLDATTPFDGSIWAYYFHGLLFATPLLAMWSVGVAALYLRAPRPPLRSLSRRPGLVLTLAALIGLVDGIVKARGHAPYSPSDSGSNILHSVSTTIPGEVGLVVVGALAVLVLDGRWRPHPSWLDRLGWCLGLAWVVLVVLSWSRIYLAALL
jgi:hypothetical protein